MPQKKKRTDDFASTSTGRGKKRSGSRSRNMHGIEFKDTTHKERYKSLESRKVTVTRYSEFIHTLQTLGIGDNVNLLLNNVGWLDFLTPRYTYDGLTLEFLSSLCFSEEKTSETNPNHRISFRLLNQDFELSFDEFCERLGFPNAGLIHDSRNTELRPEGFNPQEFWSQITGENRYEARSAKASLIHNPVFRYIHRVMACTIFGRGEMGGVRVGELFMLWAMVHGHQVNTCYYLINHLAHVADQDRGTIVVGGMITYIAEKFGLDDRLVEQKYIEGNRDIDLDLCVHMFLIKMVDNTKSRFHLLIDKQKSILLPNPARTDTRIVGNWLYLNGGGEIPQEEPVQEREEQMAEQEMQDETEFNMQEWCARIENEQHRQGAELQVIREEQLNQSQQMGRLTDMLQAMMQHFSVHQTPPPEQQ